MHMLDIEIGRSDWRGHACSLLLAAVDNFDVFYVKSDDAPDDAIDTFARSFRQGVRPGDMVGRTGLAELGVILPETGVPEAERLYGQLSSNVEWYFTISAGVACFPVHAANPQDLMNRARAALEAAQERGGHEVIHLDEALPGARGFRAVW